MTRDLSNLTISVVENSPTIRRMVRRILRSLGAHQGMDFPDSASALAEFRHRLPDIAIIDVDLTPEDGLVITQFIRRSIDSANPYLPIIMMVGNSDPARVVQARDAGVTEILAKPVSAPSLHGRIVEILDRPRRFIRAGGYFGPDRRRRSILWIGRERRVTTDADDFTVFLDPHERSR